MTVVDPLVFRTRLAQAAGTDNLYAWAAKAGVGTAALQAIHRGSIPKAEALAALRDATGKSIDWLLGLSPAEDTRQTDENGSGASGDQFVYIPRYNIEASAGTGYYVDAEPRTKYAVAFRRDWVREHVPASPKDLAVVRVRGDSMVPVLEEGDLVLINRAATKPANGGMFVFRLHDALSVKRFQVMPKPGVIQAISANPDYPTYEIDLNEIGPETFEIIGRVVWCGRRVK